MVEISELQRTTAAIIAARRALAEAREQVIDGKEALKSRECFLISVVAGKNEKEREANIRKGTTEERGALLDAERLERSRVLDLEIQKDIRRCQENMISVELMKED